MNSTLRFFSRIILPGLLCTCATTQDPPLPIADKTPQVRLSFGLVEFQDIDHVSLVFHLELDNPRPVEAKIDIEDWRLLLNGVETSEGVNFAETRWEKIPSQTAAAVFPARLELNLAALRPPALARCSALDFSEYAAQLQITLLLRDDSGAGITLQTQAETTFPRIREPRFTITSITVKRAELINTRLKLGLRIDNPNIFPLELSSLRYELYGGGNFWADGAETAVFSAAPNSSTETELSLLMNFINTRRQLLDQIIALGQVHYRFAGAASVSTDIPSIPRFPIRFDLSGSSSVVE